jgi:hypothetical protein
MLVEEVGRNGGDEGGCLMNPELLYNDWTA